MSQANGNGVGPNLDVPEEILSVIPSDPFEQLDLARKITSMAIATRVSTLESHVATLNDSLFQKDRLVFSLQDKLSALTHASQDADSRLKLALDDNMKLTQERDQLALTVKKLTRDLSKLEAFKRQLMQSLNDDNQSTEPVDIVTCDQSVPKAYPDKDENGRGYAAHHSYNNSATVGSTNDEGSRYAGNKFSITPYITPRLTPQGTPKVISTAGSPRGYSAAGSPKKTSGATSPTKLPYEGRQSLSSWYPSSQQSSAANSPPRARSLSGRTPRIDGKEFFRQARSRLSYEQFSAFLANIKELNAQKQTREETLRKADEIFGTENKDLFLSFQGLLSRNAH